MNEKQTDNFAIILTQIRYVLRGQEPLEWPDSVRFDDLTPSAMVTLNLDSLKSRIDDLMNDLSRHSIPPHVTLVAGYVSALPRRRIEFEEEAKRLLDTGMETEEVADCLFQSMIQLAETGALLMRMKEMDKAKWLPFAAYCAAHDRPLID